MRIRGVRPADTQMRGVAQYSLGRQRVRSVCLRMRTFTENIEAGDANKSSEQVALSDQVLSRTLSFDREQ